MSGGEGGERGASSSQMSQKHMLLVHERFFFRYFMKKDYFHSFFPHCKIHFMYIN